MFILGALIRNYFGVSDYQKCEEMSVTGPVCSWPSSVIVEIFKIF